MPLPITDISQLDVNQSYTYADYLLWQFEERVELIRGKLFRMCPAPNTRHQRISHELSFQLESFLRKQPCQIFSAPFDVRLPVSKRRGQDTTVVQPDLCVICDPDKLDERGCAGAPDLIIEILSPGNSKKEMREKFEAYEEAGVREYWLVNPLDNVVLIYVLNEAGKYIGLAPVTEDQELRAAIFPDLVIDLKEVFG